MEGYLKKHLNVFKGWKRRYFILHEDILVYSEEKGGKLLGQMHLKVCSIQQSKDDVLLIIINSGTKELKIKAKDILEKVKWINCLQAAQDQIVNKNRNIMDVMQSDQQLGNEFKKYFKESRLEKVIQQQMAEVWSIQAQLEQKVSEISTHFPVDVQLRGRLDEVVDLTSQIKQKVADTCRELEYENKQLYYLAKNIQNNLNQEQQPKNTNIDHLQFNDQDEFDSLDINNYESFIGDEDAHYHDHNNNNNNNNNNNPINANNDIKSISNILSELAPTQNGYTQFLSSLKSNSEVKHRIIAQNKIFQEYQVDESEERDILPAKKDPNEKLNIFSLLKDAIGKDLTKFAVPVYLNEPLSMLQRLCEQFEYRNCLEMADQQEQSHLRMAYVMGFGLSITASTIGRIKKPFNPMLGETYEMIDKASGLSYISEQVCHHPPISAGYAKTSHFEYWSSSNVKTQFWGKSMEIKPQGSTNVRLLKSGDHITYTKNKTVVNNIIIGKTYVDHCGEMIFINHITQETGVLHLKQRGWRDRGAFEVEGEIKDQNGLLKSRLYGRWDQELIAVDPITKQETTVWKRIPLANNSEDYYHFTQFSKQLNHINMEKALKIAITDSRLRPDQKALEAQQLQFAAGEKQRLEEKQRGRRKEYAKIGKEHKPVWFQEEINKYTKEKEYVYKGGYFEARDKNSWPSSLLDIF